MFDTVRNNKKLVQIILALITLPFAFWGIDSYFRSSGTSGAMATVDGTKITIFEFQQAMREQQDKLRPALAGRDPALLDTPELRRAVLDSLIQRRLMTLYTIKSHLTVSNEQLMRAIAAVPQLQEDGEFSPARYDALVAAQNMSKAMFEFNVRQDMAVQQGVAGISQASLPGKTSTELWLAGQLEARDVVEATLKPERYQSNINITPEAIKKYYDENLKKFEVAEQLRVEYLVLSRDKLAEQAQISDADVQNWYQSHADRYKQAEERRASHILISANKDMTPEQAKAAEAKAAEVLAQVKKSPQDFAKLARQFSQDPGSAEKGGDLDWFARGAMVKAFEDTVFTLKEGEISDIVKSDFGYHIIKVTGIHPEHARPLENVKNEIIKELRRDQAAKKYAEAAENFSNTVYEQSDSLAPAAEKFHLTVQQSDWLTKAAQGNGPLNHPKLQAAIFSEDAIKTQRNTEAVEVAPNQLVAARVIEHKPAFQQTLEAVTPTIQKLLADQEGVKLAIQDGEKRLASLNGGTTMTDLSWSKPINLTRANPQTLTPEAVRSVFLANTGKLPAYTGISTANGYTLYRIDKVRPYSKPEGEEMPVVGALRTEFGRIVGDEEMIAWLATLKTRFPIEINQAILEAKDR